MSIVGRYCPLCTFPSRASPQSFKMCLLWRGSGEVPTVSRYIPLWVFPSRAYPQDFKTRLLWRGSSPTPTSVLQRPIICSDTVCNSSSPELTNIVQPITYRHQPYDFKTLMIVRDFHTL